MVCEQACVMQRQFHASTASVTLNALAIGYLRMMHLRTLAVCSWSLRPEDVNQLIERVHACGMNSVQLDVTHLADTPHAWSDLPKQFQQAGIHIVSGMLRPRGEDYSSIARIRETGGVRSDATWLENQHLASRVANTAAEMGIPLVTFHAGCIPHDRSDPLRQCMLDRLVCMVDLFGGAGVRVAFETGQESAECLLAVLHELNRTKVGVNFDPANMLLYGAGDPLHAFRMLKPWVRQVHAKDALPSGKEDVWGKETPIGKGAVPWKEFMEEVKTLPPHVAVVIEREGGERRVQEVAAARAFLQPMM